MRSLEADGLMLWQGYGPIAPRARSFGLRMSSSAGADLSVALSSAFSGGIRRMRRFIARAAVNASSTFCWFPFLSEGDPKREAGRPQPG